MRRILVALKRVIDPDVRIHLHADGSGVISDGVKMGTNPFCEIALEEALRIRESGAADEVIAVTIGDTNSEQQLRTGLAMGADRAIRVHADKQLEPLSIARVLSGLIARESPLLVLLGKQSIDTDNNQTGQMLAGLWNRPQATFASLIRVSGDSARVERETDHGIEEIEVDLPAVITSDLRLNEPRFVKLPQILKARKQPIEQLSLDELQVIPVKQFETVETLEPDERAPGIRVGSVAELLLELRQRKLLP